jgi:hypothetical protein
VCYLSNQSINIFQFVKTTFVFAIFREFRLKISDDSNFDCENNINEAARAYCDNLLRSVSRERYEKVFPEFEAWCNKIKVETITEEVGASVHRRVEVYIRGGGIHRKFHSE